MDLSETIVDFTYMPTSRLRSEIDALHVQLQLWVPCKMMCVCYCSQRVSPVRGYGCVNVVHRVENRPDEGASHSYPENPTSLRA